MNIVFPLFMAMFDVYIWHNEGFKWWIELMNNCHNFTFGLNIFYSLNNNTFALKALIMVMSYPMDCALQYECTGP